MMISCLVTLGASLILNLCSIQFIIINSSECGKGKSLVEFKNKTRICMDNKLSVEARNLILERNKNDK
ncbi:MAG: hypothetical protein COB41_00370 [Proteobacteria bacterium]|nr:MAG: hypothetical protein COB41_00370 [Pseudomonadota bacterium]